MPFRPDQHITADRAVAEVQRVLISAGLISEIMQKDYGEDLLVNVALDGVVYPVRFWIQVKGRRKVADRSDAESTVAVQLSTDHLSRWSQSADPVLVVLWNVDAGVGWWHWVEDYDRDLDIKRRASRVVRISSEHRFDAEAARQLAWEALLRHYTRAIMQVRAAQDFNSAVHDDATPASVEQSRMDRRIIALDALRALGVVGTYGFPVRFFAEVLDKAYHNLPEADEETDDERWRLAVTIAVLRTICERTLVPIPELLCFAMVDVMLAILSGIGDSAASQSS